MRHGRLAGHFRKIIQLNQCGLLGLNNLNVFLDLLKPNGNYMSQLL
jgi:hypothetical protein